MYVVAFGSSSEVRLILEFERWRHTDIIVCLILGVGLVGVFLYWQHYLESVQATPGVQLYSVLTPPPLMKLSLWTRGNGRFAAMMAIAFTNWCAFMSWTFWVQVRLGLLL